MERLIQILIGAGILYAAYAMSLKKWDYTSVQKREEQKLRLKRKGLSVRYYFIPAGRLLVFNVLSGGVFFFYWSYKQWQAVKSGYKNEAGVPLKFAPAARALLSFISFYQLAAIVGRTCAYMRKKTPFPAIFWGTALWGGLAGAFLPLLPLPWRVLCAALYLLAPCALQMRINSLPKEPPPSRVKTSEILWALAGWLVWGGFAAAWRAFAR